MSLFAAPTAIPHGAIAPARPQPRARLRKTKLRFVLNLLMALSI